MKMKVIIVCMLALSLLFACGCADKKEAATDDVVEETGMNDVADTTDSTEDVSPGEDTVDDESVNDSAEVGSISKEDLDELKAELEDMEFDDVGGLSE